MMMLARKTTDKKVVRRSREETEFRPAALEILEQPLSPIRAGLIWVICLCAVSALVWGYFGTFDIVATAQGKLQPRGRVKSVQSIETGRAIAVNVGNGASVDKGDVLLQLDQTDAKAELQSVVGKLHALRAAIVRRDQQLVVVRRWKSEDVWSSAMAIGPLTAFDPVTPVGVVEREHSTYVSQMEELAANIATLRAQRVQQQATITRLTQMIRAQEDLNLTLGQQVEMRKGLAEALAGSRAVLLDAIEAQQQELATTAELNGQLLEARAAFETATKEGEKTVAAFVAQLQREQSEAFEQVEELEQQRVRVANRLEALTITSPIDGTVQASALTTLGQVVSPGTELMRIVPRNAPLEVEAYLPNKDIGFVSVGQPAVLKIEAFPFTRYGTIEGTVSSLASDAIPEPDAEQLEGQPAKELQSIVPVGNAQRAQNLVFPITVRPVTTTIEVDGNSVPLTPGMAVSVEVKTGKRRILEYLFSPISEVTSEAMRER